MPDLLMWAIAQQGHAGAELEAAVNRLSRMQLTDNVLAAMQAGQQVAHARGKVEAFRELELHIRSLL